MLCRRFQAGILIGRFFILAYNILLATATFQTSRRQMFSFYANVLLHILSASLDDNVIIDAASRPKFPSIQLLAK